MKSFLAFAASLLITVPVFAQSEIDASSEQENTIVINDDSIGIQETYNYNFGAVKINHSRSERFRLRNNGTYPFYISSIKTSGKAFSHTENCGGLLWPGQSCRATVRFSPKEVRGYSGTLRFSLIGRDSIIVYLYGWGRN